MAEGEFEMDEFSPMEFPEYDGMSNEDLKLTASNLRDSLVNEDVDTADTTKRIRYIEDKLLPSVEETSFVDGDGGTVISTAGEGEVGVSSLLHRMAKDMTKVADVDKFIEDTHGVKVDWGSDSGKNLVGRLGVSKGGDIIGGQATNGG